MPSLNKVMIMGSLTRDPEVKYTPKGTALCQIGVAVNHTYKTAEGEKREEVTFVDVEVWGKTAEIIGEHFRKGRPIYVEGRLKLDTWDDKQTGQKRSKMKVIMESFQFLGDKSTGGREGDQGRPPAPSRQGPPSRAPRPPADPDLDVPDERF
jgi:single-strand DNA-binding protein